MNNILLERLVIDKDLESDNIDSSVVNILDNITLKLNLNKSKNITFNLGNNSHLIIYKTYNEKDINEEININLNGEGSTLDYRFSTLTKDNQKYIINVYHNNKHTISNIINRGVVINDSKLVFEVNSYVSKGNINSVLNQESKIIIMSKNNSIIKPNLYIDEYNVDARHAASIGKFNKDEIFYLMTKGLSKKDSTNLLIDGFLNIRR